MRGATRPAVDQILVSAPDTQLRCLALRPSSQRAGGVKQQAGNGAGRQG